MNNWGRQREVEKPKPRTQVERREYVIKGGIQTIAKLTRLIDTMRLLFGATGLVSELTDIQNDVLHMVNTLKDGAK